METPGSCNPDHRGQFLDRIRSWALACLVACSWSKALWQEVGSLHRIRGLHGSDMNTVDGRNPFRTTQETLEGFDSPANAKNQWFQPWFLRWCEMDFVHPQHHSMSSRTCYERSVLLKQHLLDDMHPTHRITTRRWRLLMSVGLGQKGRILCICFVSPFRRGAGSVQGCGLSNFEVAPGSRGEQCFRKCRSVANTRAFPWRMAL